MDALTKLFFVTTKKNHFVEFDKEGAPQIIYKSGERYEIPSLRPSHNRLEIDELNINKIPPPDSCQGETNKDKVLNDLKSYCSKNNIKLVLMGAKWNKG